MCLPLWQVKTVHAETPVNAGGTAESFAQLVTVDIAQPSGGPVLTASAVMSVESSPSCESPNTGNDLGLPFPVFLAQSIPLDANSLPAQITYFNSYFYYFGLNQHYIVLAGLDVSCTISSTSSSSSYIAASTYHRT